ncbi:MAG: DUF433 domain-containing protein [Halobacteriales archaeon]|nr:DUF433 domain-containing protein [Halobacteriales archaeon]
MAGTGYTSDSDGSMPRIVATEGVLGGDPRIEGHRIGVYHVYRRHTDGGQSPEEIAAAYELTVGEVHAALAYAFSNPDEMRDIEARIDKRSQMTSGNRVLPEDAD